MVTTKRVRRPTLQQLEYELADLRVSLANANERLGIQDAVYAADAQDLDWALRHIAKVGGFMPAEDVKRYREAVARHADKKLHVLSKREMEQQRANEAWLASKERG